MELKLIIFDVDGTLYDLKSHCIPQSCTEAIRQLKRNKIRFAIASGRAHYGMGKALNDLRADYIIADSGGVIVDSEGNMLYHEDMPFARMLPAARVCSARGSWSRLQVSPAYVHLPAP